MRKFKMLAQTNVKWSHIDICLFKALLLFFFFFRFVIAMVCAKTCPFPSWHCACCFCQVCWPFSSCSSRGSYVSTHNCTNMQYWFVAHIKKHSLNIVHLKLPVQIIHSFLHVVLQAFVVSLAALKTARFFFFYSISYKWEITEYSNSRWLLCTR